MKPPIRLVEQYFQTYAEGARKRPDGSWYGGCPTCHEGKSWGVKHRLFYTPSLGLLHCHNCNRSWPALKWMMEVSGKTFAQIKSEFGNYDYINSSIYIPTEPVAQKPVQQSKPTYDLPFGTVSIMDKRQLAYYGMDPLFEKAIQYVKRRRLDTCYNKVDYGFTKRDYVHHNRLVIPFKDFNGKIVFYQTRQIGLETDDPNAPKYLSQDGAQKSVFGIDHIDPEIRNIYITEGPIDSCFIPNGVSLAGLIYTDFQLEQLSRFFLFEKIWVLDNDFRKNPEVLKKYIELIKRGERVFIWPHAFDKYKDINDVCVDRGWDVLPVSLFDKYSYSGDEAAKELKRAVLE